MRLTVGLRNLFVLMLLITASCGNKQDELPPKTDEAPKELQDNMSVKKLSADSSSEMPISVPKDTTVEMPNPNVPPKSNN